MCILLFITTLTASPYASIVILVSILTLIVSLNNGNFFKWLIFGGLFILFISLLPWLWKLFVGAMVPGASALNENTDITVINTIKDGAHGFFLTKIKPLYLLIAICFAAIPYYAFKAISNRDLCTGLCALGFVAGVLLVFSTDFIFNDVLQDHQRKRIEVLLGLKEDPSGVGYNVNQSMIAIGSGGLLGKGYLNGTQTTFGFVPEQSTDFIFCTVGEEWGFVGCSIVILLYVFMIWRILRDAERSRETFTRVYGYCVASCIFMHLFINIGMTIGLMPVIGIPLPLLSYGGSSLWGFTVLLFIFIALDREEKKYF